MSRKDERLWNAMSVLSHQISFLRGIYVCNIYIYMMMILECRKLDEAIWYSILPHNVVTCRWGRGQNFSYRNITVWKYHLEIKFDASFEFLFYLYIQCVSELVVRTLSDSSYLDKQFLYGKPGSQSTYLMNNTRVCYLKLNPHFRS